MHRLGAAFHGSTRAGALLRSLPPPTHLTTGPRVRWNSLREVLALAFGSSATSLYHPAAHTLLAAPWSGCQVRTGQDAALQGRNPAGTPRTVHQPSPRETASLPGPRARGHGGSGSPSPQLCLPHGILLPRRAGGCSGVCRVSEGLVPGTERPAVSLTGGMCRSCLTPAALLRGPHDESSVLEASLQLLMNHEAPWFSR